MKRRARTKARAEKRRRQKPPEPKTPSGEPVVRLRGAEISAVSTQCGESSHLVHVIRDGVHVKAIITPCGIKAALAGYHLGGDTCGRFIELLRGHVSDRRISSQAAQREGFVDELGLISNVSGGNAAYETRESWRLRRRQLASAPSWDRNELTLPALQKLVAQAAGPGTTVTFGENDIRVKVPEHDVESRYLWMTGSWGLCGGPGVPAISSVIKRWSRRIGESVHRRNLPQRRA